MNPCMKNTFERDIPPIFLPAHASPSVIVVRPRFVGLRSRVVLEGTVFGTGEHTVRLPECQINKMLTCRSLKSKYLFRT